MTVPFIDTNLVIRYFVKDDPKKAELARRTLIRVAAGALIVQTCEAVITEVVHILSSRKLYNVQRSDIRKHVSDFLRLPGLKIPHKRAYLRALELYATSGIDFVDAILVAHMERSKVKIILSFDHHFDRIEGITRQEL